ncbi:hypothetical protein FOZ62_028828, partial [Perkinsus olseni]
GRLETLLETYKLQLGVTTGYTILQQKVRLKLEDAEVGFFAFDDFASIDAQIIAEKADRRGLRVDSLDSILPANAGNRATAQFMPGFLSKENASAELQESTEAPLRGGHRACDLAKGYGEFLPAALVGVARRQSSLAEHTISVGDTRYCAAGFLEVAEEDVLKELGIGDDVPDNQVMDLVHENAYGAENVVDVFEPDEMDDQENLQGGAPPQQQNLQGGAPPQQQQNLQGGAPPQQQQNLQGGAPPQQQQQQNLHGGAPLPQQQQQQNLQGGAPPQQQRNPQGGAPPQQQQHNGVRALFAAARAAEDKLEVTTTNKQHAAIWWKDRLYSYDARTKKGLRYRCMGGGVGIQCSTPVTVNFDLTEVIREPAETSHAPGCESDARRREVNLVARVLELAAQNKQNIDVQDAVAEVGNDHLTEENIINLKAQSTYYKRKHNDLPKLPQGVVGSHQFMAQTHENIAALGDTTKSGEAFLRFNDAAEKIAIWAATVCLEKTPQADMLFVDGTFYVCPPGYHQ